MIHSEGKSGRNSAQFCERLFGAKAGLLATTRPAKPAVRCLGHAIWDEAIVSPEEQFTQQTIQPGRMGGEPSKKNQ